MPIISQIGRRSWRTRLWLGGFYAVLVAGALTMVYPFLLMLATSVTGPADAEQFDLIPRFLYEDDALFLRVTSEKYLGGDTLADMWRIDSDAIPAGVKLAGLERLRRALGDEIGWTIEHVDDRRIRELREYEQFLREHVPQELLQVGFEREVGVPRVADRLYWDFVHDRFGGDLDAMNRAYNETRPSFLHARLPLERVMYRNWTPPEGQRYDDFLEFKQRIRTERPELLQSLNGNMAWQRHLQAIYDTRVERLNQVWGTSHASFSDLYLPSTWEDAGQGLSETGAAAARADWEDFVRRKWSPRHLRWPADGSAAQAWQRFLQATYTKRASAASDALAALNRAHGTSYRSFSEIPMPAASRLRGSVSADFFQFLRASAADAADDDPSLRPDLRSVQLVALGGLYRQFLRGRFDDLDSLNHAYGRDYRSWRDVWPPMAAYDWWAVMREKWAWRWYLATNNFRLVFDLLLLRGNALVNTIAFIVLTIAFQIIVNPLCAFALSRFNLPYAEKVLLFLLATMAFPAEVTMIPGFLLLRDLNLLNTFAALLLPAMVQGFSIFILKGFFDGLPREIFEAATLDGCGELRLFFQVLVPLAGPIFAYLALLAFTAAYTSFLFALVICQDSRMWTLMVWIYQLQATVHESAQVAALLVVMVPTLLVFALCQRVIMRGIVLPQAD